MCYYWFPKMLKKQRKSYSAKECKNYNVLLVIITTFFNITNIFYVLPQMHVNKMLFQRKNFCSVDAEWKAVQQQVE